MSTPSLSITQAIASYEAALLADQSADGVISNDQTAVTNAQAGVTAAQNTLNTDSSNKTTTLAARLEAEQALVQLLTADIAASTSTGTGTGTGTGS